MRRMKNWFIAQVLSARRRIEGILLTANESQERFPDIRVEYPPEFVPSGLCLVPEEDEGRQ